MKGFIELHWMEEPLMIRASAINCVSPSDRKGCTEVYMEGVDGPFNVNESYEQVLHLMQGAM